MQDVAAIAAAAHAKGALVLMDNTWASPLYFRALDHGVDLVDPGRHQIYRRPFRRDARHGLGQRRDRCAAQDHRRLERTGASVPTTSISACAACARWRCGSSAISDRGSPSRAGWSSARKCCACCIRRMASHPGHALWKRDFTGASGLFSVVLKPVPQKAVYAFLDALELFGIGASWGGYESLAIPFDCTAGAHRDALAAGRPDGALPYRARSRRGPYRRSRTRLCALAAGA